MDASSVSLQQVAKHFGSTQALAPTDLEALAGEFLVMLGPSGCGKSTLLRIIAGLEAPSSGRVFVGGTDVTDTEPRNRDVAMVFQNYALYPHLSVRRNIEFPLRARHVAPAERARIAEEAAATLQLTELLERKPSQLSGGQRQRVALARAIVRSPKAFLMDEPLSNLDARLRVEMRAELSDLHRRTGTTVIYVTHDQVEAMTMGDRIAVLNKGELRQVGTPAQVHDKPADTFVAGFVGSPPMNLFAGEVAPCLDGGGAPVISVEGGSVPTDSQDPPAGVSHVPAIGTKVTIGLRPEQIVVSHDNSADRAGAESGPGARGPTFGAVVALVESLGHEQHVVCRLGDGATVIVRQPASMQAPALGESVRLALAPTGGTPHLFDATTGVRLDRP